MMRLASARAVAFVSITFVVSVSLYACSGGGGSTGGSSGGNASSVDGFIQEYCAIIADCCGKSGYPSDGAQCRSFAGAAAGSRQYNAAKGQDCLAGYRAASTSPTFCENPEAPASCSEVFQSTGGAPPGAQCEDDTDCAPSAEGQVDCSSTYNGSSTTRTCQVRVRAKEGEDCIGTKDGNTTSTSTSGNADAGPPTKVGICYTEDGLYCNRDSTGTSSVQKCARIQDIGGACSSSGDYACVKTAYCDYQQKKCAARLAAGADCGVNGSSDVCAEKLYCDQTTKKCTASLPSGAACQRNEQCESRDCTNGKCDEGGFGGLGYALLCGPKS